LKKQNRGSQFPSNQTSTHSTSEKEFWDESYYHLKQDTFSELESLIGWDFEGRRKKIKETKRKAKEREQRKQRNIRVLKEIKSFAQAHGYAYEVVEEGVLITSIQDKWCINFHKDHLSLFHKNQLGHTTHYHHQRDFSYKAVSSIGTYIKGHDDYVSFERKNAWKKEV